MKEIVPQKQIGPIKVIVGLGNPGKQHYHNRHSIGFRIVDALASKYNVNWTSKENAQLVDIKIDNTQIMLIKPQTFMNNSGQSLSFLLKKGIKAENILVAHDELELPFGKIKTKIGGSAKGHNGLKSIINYIGPDFARLQFGIGRPEKKDEVPNYVLQDFSEPAFDVEQLIEQSIKTIENFIVTSLQERI